MVLQPIVVVRTIVPVVEQVASDFLAIHNSALANKMRDDAETDRALKKKTLELEDIKQTKEEEFRTKQLATSRTADTRCSAV